MIFEPAPCEEKELAVLARLNDLRASLKYALRAPKRWVGFLRRNLFAAAIRGSNSIEGYVATFEQAVAAAEGEQPLDGDSETMAAILGYRNAMTYILQLADDPYCVVNEELIRGLHYTMLAHDLGKNPGRWRPGSILVRHEPTGEVVYRGPDAEAVPKLMRELVESVSGPNGSTHAIVRAAMAHLNLVMIHPFSDGNGRMGRAIQTLVLARDGILEPSFASIEEYLGAKKNTDDYYDVLGTVGAGAWNPDRDTKPWIRFCLTAHYRQAMTVARRVAETERLWNELETEITRRGLPERTIFALADGAIGLPVRSARYRLVSEASMQLASRDFATLVREGLLVPRGEKRGRVYYASEYLTAIRDKTREPRPALEDPFA
jgi:Fic family protein